ncbi:peptidase inhibitor family I36 protein [Amycolatopsis sp. NPDC049688]|uniref:peptidase inhibitor family I36 protein n=1 Tax=Amycolatopsis sp. NPDC049688 TaxID=3154733 RepID=UPI003442B0F7
MIALIDISVTPASATTENWEWCQGNEICLYDGANGTNHLVTYADPTCNHLINFGLSGYGDRTTSVWNTTGHPLRLYNWLANIKEFSLIQGIGAGVQMTLNPTVDNIADAVEMAC